MRISFRHFAYWLVLGVLTATILVACNSINNTRVTNSQPQADTNLRSKEQLG
ncbi:hypothetical protein IQ230_25685 [Gloeocapsopsis crepidinum LEGE 06123]|uniref:Uncharacterized protein n=1 Tax=Gloeocapsopsis crepidinum LEGE 06123 TaxID=588587 RepID=A0ABR9UZA9_9CHRO|nr:hypothetical protein [Gloeocapsopsis crepidinum LEGE 06123]